jgi:glucose-1-phosphate adenylyltransferase
VPPEQRRRFGMVTFGPDGRIRSLEEKPESSTTPFASIGIYLFETEVLGEWLRGNPVNLVLDVLRPMLDAGVRMVAHEFHGFWEDVGTIGSYYRASLELLAPEPRFLLHDQRWPILTRDEERPPVLLGDGAQVENSLIANGCRVAGTVRNSVLFPGVRVEPGAEVVDSVVMADVALDRGARVDRAILDKYAHVGADAVIGHGEVPAGCGNEWLEGLTLVGKEAEIPPRARVGRSVVIGVGGGPPDFAAGEIAAGTVVPNRLWFGGSR